MKNSIILGIALVSFMNMTASNGDQSFVNNDINQLELNGFTEKTPVTDSTRKTFSPIEEETVILNPETVLVYHYEKTNEELIAENNQIIESTISNEFSFLYLEKSIEDVIAENNQIIESNSTTEVAPLWIERTTEEEIMEDNKIIESTISNEIQPLDFEIIKEI